MHRKIIAACWIGCLLALLAACQDSPPAASPVRTVLVQAALAAPDSPGLYVGEVRARHEVDLAFRVPGKLQQRLVEVGDVLRPGQPLARLDPEDLRLASAAARAQLAAAESELATARAEHLRHADLLARQFISQAAFDAKAHAWRSAQSRVEQAQAQLGVADRQQQYATLDSPFPAVVTAVLAEAGQVLAVGQPVARVARPDEMEILIAVPENRREEIRAANTLTVNLWAQPKTTLRGVLRELSPLADPATRTYSARIRLLEAPPGLALGMTARVSVATAAAPPLLVPLAAVFDLGQGARVWTVADGKVHQRPVRIERFLEHGALVAEGLHEGELVVAAGALQLTPEQAVAVRHLPPPGEQR